MPEENTQNHSTRKAFGGGWLGLIIRFVVSALVLLVVSYITPGFSGLNFVTALIAAVVIAVIGYVIELLFGRRVSPYGRGGIGFIVSAAVIYLAQFVVPGMTVSILGALIAAFIIGVIDIFIPTEVR